MPISYAPTSWNPTVGCTPASEGCEKCWAANLHNRRYTSNREGGRFLYEGRSGLDAIREARRNANKLPFPPQYDMPFANVQLLPDRLSEPLRWRKPRTVAVCFMGDLFHPEVPDEFLLRVYDVMLQAKQHTFLILTKRAERMRHLFSLSRAASHIWLGVTAENQRMADERIPVLLDTPGNHWVSLEPLLSSIDLTRVMGNLGDRVDLRIDALNGRSTAAWHGRETNLFLSDPKNPRLDWVVVGGESGPRHRPMDLGWAKDIVDQCTAANVDVYFKQIAASRPGQRSGIPMLDTAKALPWPQDGRERAQEEEA